MMRVNEIASSPPRTGRHLQRYNQGFRQVVGCIPYRRRKANKSTPMKETTIEDLEILLISSQKSPKMMFPKGGWELDEDIGLAASRETIEEAGVIGLLEDKLGEWIFKSKSQDKYHEGSMFPLMVTEVLNDWPEKNVRQRIWVHLCFYIYAVQKIIGKWEGKDTFRFCKNTDETYMYYLWGTTALASILSLCVMSIELFGAKCYDAKQLLKCRMNFILQMTVNEAREVCAHSWMKEALEVFVHRFRMVEEPFTFCRLQLYITKELILDIGAQSAE